MKHRTAQKRQTSATPIPADLCRKRKSANGNNPVGVAVADLSGPPTETTSPTMEKKDRSQVLSARRVGGEADHLGIPVAIEPETPCSTATGEGVSMEAGAQAIGIDRRTVRRLVADFDLESIGTRAGRPVFRLSDLREALSLHRNPHPDAAQALAMLGDLTANLPGRLSREGIPPGPH